MKQPRRAAGSSGTKRLEAFRAQSSLRSTTHGIPSWEHPRKAPTGATGGTGLCVPSVRNNPLYPYKPPKITTGRNTAQATGTNTDHHAKLLSNTQNSPTPVRMMVSFGGSGCPSVGSITVDLSESHDYHDTPEPVIVETPSLDFNNSASTIQRSNLRKDRAAFSSLPPVEERNSYQDTRPPNQAPTGSTSVGEKGSQSSLEVPSPTKLDRPSKSMSVVDKCNQSDSEIFCQRKGLSFREAPPDVSIVSLAAQKKKRLKSRVIARGSTKRNNRTGPPKSTPSSLQQPTVKDQPATDSRKRSQIPKSQGTDSNTGVTPFQFPVATTSFASSNRTNAVPPPRRGSWREVDQDLIDEILGQIPSTAESSPGVDSTFEGKGSEQKNQRSGAAPTNSREIILTPKETAFGDVCELSPLAIDGDPFKRCGLNMDVRSNNHPDPKKKTASKEVSSIGPCDTRKERIERSDPAASLKDPSSSVDSGSLYELFAEHMLKSLAMSDTGYLTTVQQRRRE